MVCRIFPVMDLRSTSADALAKMRETWISWSLDEELLSTLLVPPKILVPRSILRTTTGGQHFCRWLVAILYVRSAWGQRKSGYLASRTTPCEFAFRATAKS